MALKVDEKVSNMEASASPIYVSQHYFPTTGDLSIYQGNFPRSWDTISRRCLRSMIELWVDGICWDPCDNNSTVMSRKFWTSYISSIYCITNLAC